MPLKIRNDLGVGSRHATRLSFLALSLSLAFFAVRHAGNLLEIPLAFEADRGAEALPLMAREVRVMAKSRKLSTFALSERLDGDTLIHHRVVEFLYPVRLSSEAQARFTANEEAAPVGCILLDKRSMVSLYECGR